MPPPRLIVAATWDEVEVGGGVVRATLRVRPAPAALSATDDGDRDVAWAEVIASVPAADTVTMRDQFDCHWVFARAVAPDKETWNLEPWRPVVDAETMIETRCNPGGPEI